MQENERSFILRNIPKLKHDDIMYIEQYYIPFGDKKHRIRFVYDVHLDKKGKLIAPSKFRYIESIYKEHIGPGQNIEHPIHVVYDDLDVFKADTKARAESKIIKIRRIYNRENKFEVDQFTDIHLIKMEVELDDINDPIVMVTEIEAEIICEVTNVFGFSNSNISYK